MANVKISNLPVAATVDGASSVPVVEGGVTKQVTFTGMLTSPALFASGMAAFFATPSSANLRAALTDETGSGAAVFADSPTLTGAVNVTGTVAATKLIPTGNVTAGNGMYLPTTNTLAWSTNGVEGMRLDASGNVSIGTTGGDFSRTWRMVARNDQDAITEIGVINTSTGASAAARIAKIGGTANNFANWELVENSGTPYDTFFYGSAVDHVRWDFAGSERMRITSAGNLGVGASPTANERIRAEGSEARIRSRNSTSGTEVYVGAMSPDEARVWASTNSPLTFGTNDTERARITSTGNVGIGTNSPAASLDVNGGVRAIQGLPTNDNSNVGFSFGPDGDTGLFSPTTGGSASGVLVFYSNASEVARFDGGNFIANVNGTAPTLSTNSTMSFELTSNTSLKIVVRGTDGVTRSVSLTLA
jgi:hypothetical protein